MPGVRRGAVVIGTAALLMSLVGCAAGSTPPAANTAHPLAPVVAASSSPATSPPVKPTPTPVAKVAAPAPPASSACAGTPVGVKHIYVSIAQQRLWACTGGVLFTSTAVTTGASALTNVHDATPMGTWRIYGKVRNTVLVGHDANGSWRDPVAYWMPFYGAYGFHDASWQTFPFGSALYRTQGSHGCVHVPTSVLGSLFAWAPTGTLVTIRS